MTAGALPLPRVDGTIPAWRVHLLVCQLDCLENFRRAVEENLKDLLVEVAHGHLNADARELVFVLIDMYRAAAGRRQ